MVHVPIAMFFYTTAQLLCWRWKNSEGGEKWEVWRRKTKQGSEQANGLSGPDELLAKRSGAEASDRISSLPAATTLSARCCLDREFYPPSPVDPTTHDITKFACSLALTFACHTPVRRDASSLQQLQEIETRMLGVRPNIQTHSAAAAATATAAAATTAAAAAATATTVRSGG